jgi:hypothetical protein
MASFLPIPWCVKASRDCTAHGDAPQTRVRQQIQKRHTQPANPYDCTRARDTRAYGRSVHDAVMWNSTGRAAIDPRQRRGTHRRKHTGQQMHLTTRHPRSHTLTNGDRSLMPTLSTAVLTKQGGGATVRQACGHQQRERSPARHTPAHGSDCLFAIRCHTMRVEPGQHRDYTAIQGRRRERLSSTVATRTGGKALLTAGLRNAQYDSELVTTTVSVECVAEPSDCTRTPAQTA